ncbi:Zinc finger protein [Actinidia chinensis var. chinensis]|uniref:Zinc finger protein n=1 Tax=Actinidia chinensis var. chinensis TaxID=1590841 RepID=A0A2R6QJ13_ACTCC|nr:Zinc finger protein [Actinidia chinensis var. chinensis]
MSSDLFVFDDSFFSDPFSPFSDSPIEILQSISSPTHQIPQNPLDETNYSDQISPPSHQLQNLSLSQTTHFVEIPNSATQFDDFSIFDVKTEDCQFPIHSSYGYQSFGAHSYGNSENVAKYMQRSYSSHSFDGKPNYLFKPQFDSLMESPNFQPQIMSSPENSFSTGQMRRVFSTGDLQKIKSTEANQRLSSSPLATESSFIEEANFKVGRYSAEERKERIHRYRAKRTQRNFNKTIKYACRKTLADNRPRIRGRFARNDETGEIPKAAHLNRHEDEDDLWMDGFHEEEEERTVRGGGSGGGGPFFNILGPNQFQYYGY